MLSVGSREDGRKGLGLGFLEMEENEIEEGEAFSEQEDDSCVDPFDLSYIDEKIHDVLGHFQKDFEGGVSAENLGAKFGGYGSFLPSYQRSPSILSQPKSPPRPPNNAVSKSPYDSSVEHVRQNSTAPISTSVSKNNTSALVQPGDSGRKANSLNSLEGGGSVPHLDLNKKLVNGSDQKSNGSDQKSMKVRIKVGPDNSLARSNAAIYSGLGLDTSPFSSPEDSLDASPGLSSEFRDNPGESPFSILQVMTCFSVPGGYLVSPLQENLSQLAETKNLFIKKTGMLEICVVPDRTLPARNIKVYPEKKVKLKDMNGKSKEEEKFDCKVDMAKELKKEMDVDPPVGKKNTSSTSIIPIPSSLRNVDPKAERNLIGNSTKGTNRAIDISNELNKPLGKERNFLPDSAKDERCISIESVKRDTISNLGNGITHSIAKLDHKTNLLEDVEEKNPANHRDTSADTSREGKGKNQKNRETKKLNLDELNGQMTAQKVNSLDKDSGKMLQGNDQVYNGKRKQKGSHNYLTPSDALPQENLRAPSSLVAKEKKINSHSRGGHSESKSRMLKSHKETKRAPSREPHRDVVESVNADRVENRANLLDSSISAEKSLETPVVKKDVNLQSDVMTNPPVRMPSACAGPTSDATAALGGAAPPELIKDDWVQCDRCQKWRLLPYGIQPHHLPKKWKCSMQDWLSGFKSCHFSEDETTNAIHALYLVPAPEASANLNDHPNIAVSSITSAEAPQYLDRRFDHNMQSIPATVKKKSGLTDGPIIPNSVSRKNLQASAKCRSLNDGNEDPLVLSAKSTDLTTDGGDFVGRSAKHSKSKHKREINEDGIRTTKKSKNEGSGSLPEDRLSDKAAPIMNKGSSTDVTEKILHNYSDLSSSKDSKSEFRGNLLASTKKPKEHLHMYSNGEFKEHCRALDMDKSILRDYSVKKRKVKEGQEEEGNQENAMCSKVFRESEPTKRKKAKVSKYEKETSMSNIDENMDKKGRPTRILLSCSRERHSDGMHEDERVVAGKEEMGQSKETAASQQAINGVDTLKRENTYSRLLTAATSSSSKVSGSRKSKAHVQEGKGSPVESVSSSPLRISIIEKLSTKRNSPANDDLLNGGPFFMGSPKRCSDGELGSDQSGTQRKEIGGDNKDVPCLRRVVQVDLLPVEYEETTENVIDHDANCHLEEPEKDRTDYDHDKLTNSHHPNVTSQWNSGRSSCFKETDSILNPNAYRGKLKLSDSLSEKKELYSTNDASNSQSRADFNYENLKEINCNLKEKDEVYLEKKNSSAKWSRSDQKISHWNNSLEKLAKDPDSRVSFTGASCKSKLQENLQQPSSYPNENQRHSVSDQIDQPEMNSGRGISQPLQTSQDRNEAQSLGAQTVLTPVKDRLEISSTDAVNGNASKLSKQSRNPISQNGVNPHTRRQSLPNGHESSPMKKDCLSIANVVFKEARDLKHTANRLKQEGLDHESIGLYFEAALKFLHGASLLEPPNAERTKQGEMNPSEQVMQMYADTARLCEYCAHEYERCDEMAAAALAYKCVEVAYMKAAYYKHPCASKDRHELLTALQTVLPGESPSSSASDVDNLNNQGALDKVVSAKANGSPQIGGNHVIAARNRPNFMRLLNYTNYLNCAFDATKRSQNAIAAASVNLEKVGATGLSSVRKVLEFSFHNVEELLRLVRLSVELISY